MKVVLREKDIMTEELNIIKQLRELDQDLSLAIKRIDRIENHQLQIAVSEQAADIVKRIEEISTYECHNRALIEDLRLTLKDAFDEWKTQPSNYDNVLVHKFNQLEKEIHGLGKRTPHKCPICCGSQRDYFDVLYPYNEYPEDTKIDHEGRKYKDCGACDGKGIVWG